MAGRCTTTFQFEHGHHAYWKQEVLLTLSLKYNYTCWDISVSIVTGKVRRVHYLAMTEIFVFDRL
jgi:hypothetical protein